MAQTIVNELQKKDKYLSLIEVKALKRYYLYIMTNI